MLNRGLEVLIPGGGGIRAHEDRRDEHGDGASHAPEDIVLRDLPNRRRLVSVPQRGVLECLEQTGPLIRRPSAIVDRRE